MSDTGVRDLAIDLPTSLSCSILSDWVSAVELARVDSAYCSKKRILVLRILQSDELVSKDEVQSWKVGKVSTQFWDWILLRDIKLFRITVSSRGADAVKLGSYAQRHDKHIGTMICDAKTSHSFTVFCKHLVQLTCDVKKTPELRTLLQNNPNLRILDLRGEAEVPPVSFRDIALPQLTQLTIDIDDYSSAFVEAVLKMPSRLLKLCLREMEVDLTGISKLCPHLRSLDLDAIDYRPGFDLAEFTSHLPHLVDLQLLAFEQLNDIQLLSIVTNLKYLRTLSLKFGGRHSLADTGIEYIAEHCAATLKVFGLQMCAYGPEITRHSLDLVRARCTKLLQFKVQLSYGYIRIPLVSATVLVVKYKCYESTLVKIANECPQLEVLQLRRKTEDCSLSSMRELCQKCPNLHRIEVQKWNVAYLKSLTATLPQLLQLQLHLVWT